jgi:hypothetical protein
MPRPLSVSTLLFGEETEETNPPGWMAPIGTNVWFSKTDSKCEHRVPVIPARRSVHV